MSYCWFYRKELLQKAKDIYHTGGRKEKENANNFPNSL